MSEPFSKFISHEMPTNECRVTNQRFKIFISISFKVFIQPCITWCKWLINAQWNVFTWQSPGENSPSSDSIKCNWTLLHSFDICSSHVFLLTAAINLFESKLECCCVFYWPWVHWLGCSLQFNHCYRFIRQMFKCFHWLRFELVEQLLLIILWYNTNDWW